MAFTGIGLNSHWMFSEETTYGTATPRLYAVEILNESLYKEVQRIETQSLTRRGVKSTQVQNGAIAVSGNVEFEAAYGGWLKLLKHALGQIDTTTPDPTNAPTAKQHKFSIANQLPTGLTMEVYRESTNFVTEPNKAFVFAGCKISTIEFSCAVDEILKVNIGVMGQNEARETKSTPTFTTEKLAVYHQGCLTWGSTELPIESFTLQVNNNLEMRPKLCSRLTREPLPGGKLEVTGSFTVEFETWEQYDDFVNATQRQLEIVFTGDLIAASQYKKIRFLASVADLVDCRITLDSPGRIMMDIDFKAYRTDSVNELEIYVVNTETGI